MGKYILKRSKLGLLFSFIFLLTTSCSEDSKNPLEGNPEEVITYVLNSATKNWGMSRENVNAHMANYETISNTDHTIQCFATPKSGVRVSYKFHDEKLCATLVIAPANEKGLEETSMLKDYTFIGELNGDKVYECSRENTLATTWTFSEAGEQYVAFGFAPIIYEAYEAIQPFVVTTIGEDNSIPYKATFSGSLENATQSTEVGFIYGMTPFLSETTDKMVSTTSQGKFSVEAKGLIDDTTYYYCAYALVDDIYYYGEVKSFHTDPLTYTLKGQTFRMIKVEGGPTGDFSMMQTEMPIDLELEIGDEKIGTLDKGDKYILKRELQEFIIALRRQTGLIFRLPLPEEWKYAASGGNKSKGYKYSGSNTLDDVAWYRSNSSGKVHDVAQKKPNELGFYDMSGNYAEIVISWKKEGAWSDCDVDGDRYGGNWNDYASGCTIESFVKDPYEGKISGTNLYHANATDGKTGTVRLMYSRSEKDPVSFATTYGFISVEK